MQMEWADRAKLAAPGGEGGLRLLQAVSCSVREGSPVLVLAHVAVNASRQYAEIRSAVLDLVDVADTAITLPDGSALRAVAVHGVAPRQLAAGHPNMQQLSVRPHPAVHAVEYAHVPLMRPYIPIPAQQGRSQQMNPAEPERRQPSRTSPGHRSELAHRLVSLMDSM